MKQILCVILSVILIIGLAASVPQIVHADTLSDLKNKQADLAKKKKEVEQSLKDSEGKADKLEEYLQYYDTKMKLQEDEIDNLKAQIAEFQSEIAELSADIETKEFEVAEAVKVFRIRLREMQISGNDNLAAVLSGSADFYDMLTRMELFERMSQHDKKMLDDLNALIDGLEADKAELEDKLANEEALKAEAETALEELQKTYDGHVETKARVLAEIADYQARGDEIEAEERKTEQQVQAEIKRLAEEAERRRLEEERKRKEEEERKRKEAEAKGESYTEKDVRSFIGYSDTGFIWPAPTVRATSDLYGNRWIVEEQRSAMHKGIDITKPGCGGEPIVASAGGEVIIAGNTYNGYGNHVVISHGNGLTTLYGHCSSLAVKVGEYVEQGDTIGYIGSTGNSYGNHLHFEVRINGLHTDPMKYVSKDN